MAAVVADTSPLIALHQIGHLSLLESLFGEVLVSPAVALEAMPSLPQLPAYIRTLAPTQAIGPQVLQASLGPGESEALSLALELNADLVILDERPARRLAAALGLPVAGTAGILLRAKQAGFIPLLRPLLDQLVVFDFHLSQAIVDEVLAEAGEAQQ
jgi:predicted nucleic acid-binding protein